MSIARRRASEASQLQSTLCDSVTQKTPCLGAAGKSREMVRHERVGQHDDATELLYAAHQRNRAFLLLVVEEERPVRKATDKVIAPVLPYKPVFPHAAIIPNSGYCINSTISISSDPSLSLAGGGCAKQPQPPPQSAAPLRRQLLFSVYSLLLRS